MSESSDLLTAQSDPAQHLLFLNLIDQLQANLYIADPVSDRILFMNKTMKEAFQLEAPEGNPCWQVLQRGQQQRCSFCPVTSLLENGRENTVCEWEGQNTANGRVYQNRDSLIRWFDGSIVHLQQSFDITELKSDETDEISYVMTRHAGRQALTQTIEKTVTSGQVITIGLYDINLLKEVNQRYGYTEGNRVIFAISQAVRRNLNEEEYSFRLNGDQFVLVFFTRQAQARQRIERVLSQLRELRDPEIPYECSFCYGLVEISSEHPLALDAALLLADERMYDQKRSFHILRNEDRRTRETGYSHTNPILDYNQALLYDALVHSTEDYLYLCDMKTGTFRYPRAMVEEFDLPGAVVENAAAVWGAKIHERDKAAFLEANQEITDGRTTTHCVEYRAQNRKGEWVWLRCRGHLVFDEMGQPSLFAGFITNLGKKGKIDPLTGLYNKFEFEEQVSSLIERAPGHAFGIMLLGVDDLHHINALYDRAFGDEVIRIASQKIQTLLPHCAPLYRLDGGGFALIVRDSDPEVMLGIFRGIHHSFSSQQTFDGKKYYATLSAGCLFYPQDATNYADLMKRAWYSLEHAQRHNQKTCVFFSPEILEHRTRALQMTEVLRESVENDFAGFSLCFQPLVDPQTRQLVACEALARWKDHRFGEVSPEEFIPLLEQSGLILPVGRWVFRNAVRACGHWNAHTPSLSIGINLSYLQIEGDRFPSFIAEVLQEESFPAENLVIELTESDLARENSVIHAAFGELQRMGVRTSMDDFGTGYSSLSFLKETPVDIVKIDRAFIRDICTSSFDATLIRFVVALCHDINIKVCLEGVETEELFQAVHEMGLDYVQGFLFGRPLTEADFTKRFFS